MMRTPVVTALLTLFVASRAVGAGSDCTDDWICINSVKQDGDVELFAENLSGVPVTFSLQIRTRYFDVEGPKSITETLAPGENRRVMAMRRTERDRKGKYRFTYQWTVGDKDAVHDDAQVYLLPYAPGHSYRVLQGFGSRFSHTGREQFAVDFKMSEGTPVHAARDGVIARVEESHSRGCWNDGCGEYANFIVVLHDDGTTGEYYHLQRDGALVDVGERIDAGQVIGLSGNTGHSTMPHLHFGVYRAVERGREQSIPFRFASADGIIDAPRRGGRYEAIAGQKVSRADGEGELREYVN